MSAINFLNDGDTGLQARTIINALVTEVNNGAGTSGTSGESGSAGTSGTSGVSGSSGTSGIGLTYLGAWSSSTNYTLNDVVRHGTPYKIYIANQAVSSGDTEPDVNAKWTVGVISGNNGQTLSPKGVEASYASMLTNHPTPTLLDTYVLQDTSELWIYDPTSTAANVDGWVNMGEIQGPAGLDGSSGSSGTSGTSGFSGTNGTSGSSGTSGLSGSSGTSGASGSSGTSGTSGSSGTSVQITQITNVTLTAASWVSANGIYEYTYSNAGITTNTIVDVIPSNSSYTAAVDAEVLPSVETATGSVKIFATLQPTADIVVTINILN